MEYENIYIYENIGIWILERGEYIIPGIWKKYQIKSNEIE